MIPGFELRRQVEAQLAALAHERKGAASQAHLDAIAAQEKVFEAELRRMAADEGDEEEQGPPASPWTQLAWMGGPRCSAWSPPR